MVEEISVVCQRCGSTTPLRTASAKNQKYCPPCSSAADIERKRRWIEKTGYVNPHGKEKNERRREIARELGAAASAEQARTPELQTKCVTSIRLSIPWTNALLKNHSWSFSRHAGHVFLRKETRAAQDDLIEKISVAAPAFKHNKIWLAIHAQKPDMRSGDAINLIDRVADAVKKAIGIDDRWFCVQKIDWQVVKVDPKIYIDVFQEDDWDGQVCSACGMIKPFDSFGKNRSAKLGIGRECRDCSRPMEALKRAEKKAAGAIGG